MPAQLDRERIVRAYVAFVCGVVALFVLADYWVNYANVDGPGQVRVLFASDREGTIADWFGTMQMAVVGLAAALIGSLEAYAQRRRERVRWLLVAAFFLYLSVDDGAHVHERLGTWLGGSATDEATGVGGWTAAFPSYAWQVTVLPGIAAAAALTSVFLWRRTCERRMRGAIVLAIGAWGAAVVLDFIEGLATEHPWNLTTRIVRSVDLRGWSVPRFGTQPFDAIQHFSRVLEESIETLGGALFAAVVLWILLGRLNDLRDAGENGSEVVGA